MANVTDFVSTAACTAAGYKMIQIDRGAGISPRFRTVMTLQPVASGASQGDGVHIEATGEDNSSQANADAKALAAMNAQRRHYFGGSPGRASGSAQSAGSRGETHVVT